MCIPCCTSAPKAWAGQPRFVQAPAFRAAFKERCCLIPADGFLEWKKEGKQKLPYLFARKDGQPLALAGLWEQWKNPQGEVIDTCSILMTEPNDLVKPLHNRMPVILDKTAWGCALNAVPGGGPG